MREGFIFGFERCLRQQAFIVIIYLESSTLAKREKGEKKGGGVGGVGENVKQQAQEAIKFE